MNDIRLLYPNEHLYCENYSNRERPIIERKDLTKDSTWDINTLTNKIVFLMKGKLKFSFGYFCDEIIEEEKMLYIPAFYHFKGYAEEDVSLIIFRLETKMQFCDRYRVEDLVKQTSTIQLDNNIASSGSLEINAILKDYLVFLDTCISKGLKCKYFFEIKIKELFFLFRAFYEKEDLVMFFNMALSMNTNFAEHIMQNYSKYTTLVQLAESMNYSVSGFEKKFKRTFGTSPYRWMKKQKASKIYHEISTSDRSFKEISADFGFNSSSHFNDFCKDCFGQTPGNIRQNKMNGGNY